MEQEAIFRDLFVLLQDARKLLLLRNQGVELTRTTQFLVSILVTPPALELPRQVRDIQPHLQQSLLVLFPIRQLRIQRMQMQIQIH